jgi:regulatory protein
MPIPASMIRRRAKPRLPEEAGDRGAARAAAVALLARRDFASPDLRRKLEEEGFDPALVAEVVAELVEGRVLQDERFAENYVGYHADRGQGPVRIAADLKALGLDAELVDAALASGPDWRALAREVRIRRFGLAEPATWAEKGKQARFLQYRGFSSDHIRAALGPDFDPDA